MDWERGRILMAGQDVYRIYRLESKLLLQVKDQTSLDSHQVCRV
jgi:hypothetical protein